MFSVHAKKRAQQRGINLNICRLLRWHGDSQDAGNGKVIRYFSKQAKRRLSEILGPRFLATNHENLRTYLIEARESGTVITVGKLYSNRRIRRVKGRNRGRLLCKKPPVPSTRASRDNDRGAYA